MLVQYKTQFQRLAVGKNQPTFTLLSIFQDPILMKNADDMTVLVSLCV